MRKMIIFPLILIACSALSALGMQMLLYARKGSIRSDDPRGLFKYVGVMSQLLALDALKPTATVIDKAGIELLVITFGSDDTVGKLPANPPLAREYRGAAKPIAILFDEMVMRLSQQRDSPKTIMRLYPHSRRSSRTVFALAIYSTTCQAIERCSLPRLIQAVPPPKKKEVFTFHAETTDPNSEWFYNVANAKSGKYLSIASGLRVSGFLLVSLLFKHAPDISASLNRGNLESEGPTTKVVIAFGSAPEAAEKIWCSIMLMAFIGSFDTPAQSARHIVFGHDPCLSKSHRSDEQPGTYTICFVYPATESADSLADHIQ